MTLRFNYNHYELYQKDKFKEKVECEFCKKFLNFSSLKRHKLKTCKGLKK